MVFFWPTETVKREYARRLGIEDEDETRMTMKTQGLGSERIGPGARARR